MITANAAGAERARLGGEHRDGNAGSAKVTAPQITVTGGAEDP
jgi:hypothetical protein